MLTEKKLNLICIKTIEKTLKTQKMKTFGHNLKYFKDYNLNIKSDNLNAINQLESALGSSLTDRKGV